MQLAWKINHWDDKQQYTDKERHRITHLNRLFTGKESFTPQKYWRTYFKRCYTQVIHGKQEFTSKSSSLFLIWSFQWKNSLPFHTAWQQFKNKSLTLWANELLLGDRFGLRTKCKIILRVLTQTEHIHSHVRCVPKTVNPSQKEAGTTADRITEKTQRRLAAKSLLTSASFIVFPLTDHLQDSKSHPVTEALQGNVVPSRTTQGRTPSLGWR